MADSRKWSVTYTKHIKQKRKLYRDGFLSLYPSTNKAMLYDESDTLLECRILKNDEIVSSGESLAFSSYLVDVGDIEGERNRPRDLNYRKNEEKVVRRFVAGQKMVNSRKQLMRMNSSQKIIRDFEKSEMTKHGAIQNDQEGTKPSATDWHVMYTTQLTQKAKKYHDGFIRCSSSGSMTRQVKLYDSKWTVLESRFVKQGEELKSGERMEFQGYLVEIGECAENHKMGYSANSSSRSSLQKLQKLKEQNYFKGKGSGINNAELQQHGMLDSSSDPGRSIIMTWQVLFTAHVTQKAKKYHDGFLQLASRGSRGRQVTLYDESRKILSNRFLKKDEVIKSGESFAFDGYLVDIGELEKQEANPADLDGKGSNDNAIGEAKGLGQSSCLKADKSVLRGESRERDHTTENMIVSHGIPLVEKMQLSQRGSQHKPLRNSSQILFILQKPLAPKGIDADSFGEDLATLASLAKGPSESKAPKSELSSPTLSPKATCGYGNRLLGEVSISVLSNAEANLESYGNTCGDFSASRSNDFSQEERTTKNDVEFPSFDLGF